MKIREDQMSAALQGAADHVYGRDGAELVIKSVGFTNEGRAELVVSVVVTAREKGD